MRSGQSAGYRTGQASLDGLLDELYGLKSDYARSLVRREPPVVVSFRGLDKYDRLGNQLLDLDKVVFIQPENTVAEGKRQISLATRIWRSTDLLHH